MRKLLAVDVTNLAHRAYHGMASSGIVSPSGQPLWVAHGVVRFLARFVREIEPSSLLLAADDGGGCPHRRHLAPDYKASRSSPPPDLVSQLAGLPELLSGAGLPFVTVPGWEADDIVASAVTQAAAYGAQSFVVSSDKDLHQLVSESVTVVKPEGTLFTPRDIVAKWGVSPGKWVDFAALCGEKSDNLEGVPGVGPKRASLLLERFADVDEIFSSLPGVAELVGARLAAAIVAFEPLVRRNVAVGTLRRDLRFNVDNLRVDALRNAPDALKALLPKPAAELQAALQSAAHTHQTAS
jgi:DNA polymerase-1